jgi:hypothetical protein
MYWALINPAEFSAPNLWRIPRVFEAETSDVLDKYPHPMFWKPCDPAVTVHTHGYSATTQSIEPLPPEAVDPRTIQYLPVVNSITRRQGRLALIDAERTAFVVDQLQAATMLDAVEALIAAIPDPIARRRAQVEYEGETWELHSQFLQAMWAQLGGTSEQLAALFIQAARR